jgi:hypothetical protein
MASIGNYAAALAEAARNAAKSSATGIGAAIRGSATSEIPGVTGAYSFAQNLRNSANSRAGSSGGGKGGGGGSASSSGPSNSSNFNAAVVRELQLMNANILEQTRLLRYQVDSAKTKSQYDEENAREQALRDSKLLDAINNLGSKGGGKGGGGGNEEGPGIGSALVSGATEGIIDRLLSGGGGGRGGRGRRGSIKGKVVKGAGIAGLGLGALYAYDRVANGGESISGVAKDLAPGAIGATVGGLIGMIGGPIGVAIGSAIGGAIGDSDFGRKMFEKILPDLENYGKILSQKFGEVSASVTKIFDDFVPTFNNIKDTITSSLTTATNYVVSAFGEINNWFTNLKFPDLGLGQVTRDPKLAKQVNAEMNAPANQAGNILGTVPNPMGGKAAKQAAMRAANANAATTSVVPNISPISASATGTDTNKVITFGSLSTEQQYAVLAEQRKQEGFKPGMLTYDLNNPGAMLYDKITANFGAVRDDTGRGVDALKGKFAKFPTLQQGIEAQRYKWLNGQKGKYANLPLNQALQLWITGKIEGTGGSHLGSKYENYIKQVYAAAGSTAPAAGPAPVTIAAAKMPQSPRFNSARDSQVAYDAMPTTPVFTGPGFGSYKEGPNPEADTPFSGSNIPENPQLKVSPLTQKMEEVRVEIRKASNATIEVAKKIGKDTEKNFKDLAQSSARTARAVAPPNKPIRPILKTPEQIIAETNKNFAMQFQKIAPRAISLALRQTLFPKGIGVSQQAAGGALFRGQQLNSIFGAGRSVSKLATSLFGKQYGGMLAPALNNLATGYLEAGARAGGRLLFGMIGGMDAEKSNILTGQILGNYARGNKKLAAEQLIFGTTGVATGYESVFAKYGFKNPMEGVNYMANTLGAAVSDPVNSLMNPGAKPTEYIDPRTGKKVSLNSTSSFNADAYGRIGDVSSTGATIQNVPGGDKAITTTDIESAKFAADQAYRDELIIAGIGDTNRILAEGRTGAGSTAGGTLGVGGGGGGFFGAGGPLSQVGNMAFDLGRVALTQNAMKALGVKNPYMQMLANFAINQGLKYAGQAAYSAVSNAFGFGGTQAAAPIVDGTLAAGGSSLAASSLASSGAASYAGGQSAGTLMGFEGSIGAAVPQTASAGGVAGAGAGLMEAASALAMNPATWIVAAFLVVGSLIMGSGGDPNPTIQRILWNADNNDIAKITTNWTLDWGQLDQNGQVAWISVCDQMLKIAFNAAKAFQVKAGSLGTNIGAFDYIGTQINKFGVIIAFYRGTPQAPLGSSIDQIDFGTPEAYSKLNANEVAKRIVKKVEELYKKGVTYDTKVTEELGKTAEALQKVSYNAIASGLLSATAGQLDTSISRATYMQPEEARGPTDYNEAGPVGGSPRGVFNEKTGSWVIDAPDNVVGYDRNGNPIYDLNSDRMLSEADFKTNLADIQAIVPSATATNTGNYIAAASAAAAVAATNATSGSSGASGGSTVVAGNNSNNTTNNTTTVKHVSSVDVLRGMTTQTALPVTG